MDDDFSSIVKGIEEGRVLFDNLTKTIAVRSSGGWIVLLLPWDNWIYR